MFPFVICVIVLLREIDEISAASNVNYDIIFASKTFPNSSNNRKHSTELTQTCGNIII